MAIILASSEQHELRFGDQRAVVVEVGGGLRSYEAGGAASSTATARPRCAPAAAAPCSCRALLVDERGLLTGRTARAIGASPIDGALTDLEAPGGRREVRLARNDGRTATLWADASFGFVQLYTGDALPEPERRRAALAVEPMTCAPGAFRSVDGLRTLAPGEEAVLRWGLSLA